MTIQSRLSIEETEQVQEPSLIEIRLLIDSLANDLDRREITDASLREERSAIRASWRDVHRNPAPAEPHRLSACDHLDATIASGLAGPERSLIEAMKPFLPSLHWRYGYALQPRWPNLERQLAFAQIIGGRAAFNDRSAHLGLTLMAPQTYYPLHAHPAIELYLVLAGTAGWRLGDAPFEDKPPGALILHRSGVGHAMQTRDEPMLALYVWRGDLETAPIYIEGPGN